LKLFLQLDWQFMIVNDCALVFPLADHLAQLLWRSLDTVQLPGVGQLPFTSKNRTFSDAICSRGHFGLDCQGRPALIACGWQRDLDQS
jgi:hypothetical protein